MAVTKPRRHCIFCGVGRVSKEHIWSVWMHPYLANMDAESHTEFKTVFSNKMSTPVDAYERTRPGPSAHKKVRAVCSGCNSGWMNRAEGKARPFLQPLIEGYPVSLTREAVDLLCLWIAMKTMVIEHSHHGDSVTPAADRRALWLGKTIPACFRIQIAYHQDWKWGGSFYRHAGSLARSTSPPAVTDAAKNIQVVSFGFGRLFVNVISSREVESDDLFVHDDSLFPRIFPSDDAWLRWPPARPLTGQEMDEIAVALDRLLKEDPRIRWQPKPPDGADGSTH